MARTQYFIVLREDEWRSSWVTSTTGSTSQRPCDRAAVEAANQDGVKGNDAQVLVQGEGEKPRSLSGKGVAA